MTQARTITALKQVLGEGLWDEFNRSSGSATDGIKNAVRGAYALGKGIYHGLTKSGEAISKSGIRIKSVPHVRPPTKVPAAVPIGGAYGHRQRAAKLHKRVVGMHPPDSMSATEIHARVLRHIQTQPPTQPRS